MVDRTRENNVENNSQISSGRFTVKDAKELARLFGRERGEDKRLHKPSDKELGVCTLRRGTIKRRERAYQNIDKQVTTKRRQSG